MIIVKCWAKNNGKISQRRLVRFENWEKAVEAQKREIELVKKQYNELLGKRNLGIVKVEHKITPKKMATTISNENIVDIIYSMEFQYNE